MTKRSQASKVKKGIVQQAPNALKQLIESKFPFAVMHSCGYVAMYLAKMPHNDQPIMPEDVILPNGDEVGMFDEPKCFNCGATLSHLDFHPMKIKVLQ